MTKATVFGNIERISKERKYNNMKVLNTNKQTNSVALSPRANYTD
jgi:hypothetical protein